MNNILIDTNIFIWVATNEKLSRKQLTILEHADSLYVSAISILEIRIKQELGKLRLFDALYLAEKMDITILPLDGRGASSYRLLDKSNPDPFDNAISSLAIVNDLTLMTTDKKILQLQSPGLRCIDARN